MTSFQSKTFTWCVLLALMFAVNCTEEKKSKPNILFIFADDLSYNAVGALGNPVVKTPNIDKIANQGATFSHAYNMGGWNGAVCVASRAMLMSGRTIWRAKEFESKWESNDSLALSQTWPRLMRKAGYDTYFTGKWHVKAGVDEVWDKATNIRPGMPRDYYKWDIIREYEKRGHHLEGWTWPDLMAIGYNRPLSPQDSSWTPTDKRYGGYWTKRRHWSKIVSDDAVEFLDQSSNSDKPFFMYVAFNAPHDPRQSPQEYLDMYPLEDIDVPDNFLSTYPFKDSIGCYNTLRDEALAPFPRTPFAVKTHIKEYYAIISHMDHLIGEVLEALRKSGELDNTYIIFSADHGLSVGRHGLMGKQNMYEHSIRVPLIIKGPDIPKGKVIDRDIYVQDIMATSIEIAGLDKPDYVEFNSLLPQISEASESRYDEIYCSYVDHQRMIRKDGFKLIAYPRVKKLRLFDLENDPLEMNDLADNRQYASKVKSMFEDLVQLQSEMGDELELEGVFEL